MQIIRNQIAIPVSQGKAILVHTLTGGMFVLGAVEYQILNNWVNKGEVVPQTPEEKTFYQLLQDNKFLTGSEEQEKAMEQETLEQSRAQYRKAQELLDSVAFVLTYQCNFRCPYCYEGNGDCNISSQNRSIMTPEMVDAIFAIHQNKIENIMLYGGEPLLPVNKETICHIISKAPNANFSATTNGYYLEEYFDIFSKLTINHLMVTLDGEESLHIEAIPECRECKLRFLCGGGCGNAVIDDSGNVLHPNCAPIMDEIQNELPALYERYVK